MTHYSAQSRDQKLLIKVYNIKMTRYSVQPRDQIFLKGYC